MTEFNEGDRVKLVSLDPFAFVTVGTEGTVIGTNDTYETPTTEVRWDTNTVTNTPVAQATATDCIEKV